MEGRENWREAQARLLRQARLVVVKVGSAVLTGPHGLEEATLASLAEQMAALRAMPADGGSAAARRIVLVSSGAVAAGRAILRASGQNADTSGLAARQAAAALGQGHLVQAWDAAFAPHGISTAQVLLTRDDLRARQRFLNARNTFAELLAWGVLPIVNENDTVSVNDLKFGDNDCLASLLVNLTGADLCINLTSAPGVLDADGQVMSHIEDVARLDLARLCGGKTLVGTGGMYSKLLAARRAAQIGVPTLILPGRQNGVLTRALVAAAAGEALPGTWICPAGQAIPRRKFWLAYQSEPVGSVLIDEGAAQALLERGSSLLPGGVRGLEGHFQKGAVLRVLHAGQSLGVGLSNYSAADLRKIMGLRRHEVAAILGDAHYPDVIHRDNLLLDAAV